MKTQPIKPGTVVKSLSGRLGLVTETVRKTGPNRGKCAVWWFGANYDTSENPQTLTAVSVTTLD